MNETVEAAKGEYTRAKDRLAKALATTPDDKINWAPSATSRTPVQQVAHGAQAVGMIHDMLVGKGTEAPGSVVEMDAAFRKYEQGFTTREQANAVLDERSASFLAWLDTLSAEQVASTVHTPFGDFPMAAAITFPADHLRNHAGQIDYIQTIYGDHDWHF